MRFSMQVSLNQRLKHGLALFSNFVWSKTIDNTSSAAEGNSGHNPLNLDTVFEFLRNTDLNARNFFQLTRPPLVCCYWLGR